MSLKETFKVSLCVVATSLTDQELSPLKYLKVKVESLSKCPTLCDPVECSLRAHKYGILSEYAGVSLPFPYSLLEAVFPKSKLIYSS